jgi:hypothetical protein
MVPFCAAGDVILLERKNHVGRGFTPAVCLPCGVSFGSIGVRRVSMHEVTHDCLSAPFLQHTVHVPPRGIDGSLHNIANGLNTFETRVPSWQVDRVLCPVALQTRTCFTRTVHAIDRPRHLESQCRLQASLASSSVAFTKDRTQA